MMVRPGASVIAMRPETDDEALDRLLHPGRHYATPAAVLADPALTPAEQRAILSSWASHACAAEAPPVSRQPPCGRRASFDEVMDALGQLDRVGAGGRGTPSGQGKAPRGAGI